MPRGGKRIAAAKLHLCYVPPATPNNNPTLMASGRVVVRNDRACPRDALNPKP